MNTDRQKRGKRRRWVYGGLLLLVAAGLGGYFVWWRTAPIVPPIATEGLDAEVVALMQQARADVIAAPRSAAAWGRLGLILYAHDMYAESAAFLAEAERLDPADARWPYLRGLGLIPQNPEAGIVALKRAAAITPTNLTMQLRWAEECLKLDRIDEADAIFRHLADVSTNHPRVLLGQGQILCRRGQWREALAPLTAAATAPTAQRSARVALAEAYLRMGNASLAETQRQHAARLPADPTWPDPFIAEAEKFRTGLVPRLEQALQLRDAGKVQDGLTLIAEILRDHPNSDKLHLTHARLLIAAGAQEPGEEALRQAIQLNPGLGPAHLLLAETLMAKHDYAGAERSFLRVIELTPAHGVAHYQLGACRLKQGNKAEAMAAFRDAVRCRPDFAVAHLELGALLLADGQVAEAIVHLGHAIHLDGTNDRARGLLERARAKKQ
jgi:tetratricopeptide (TPR) repeat protein